VRVRVCFSYSVLLYSYNPTTTQLPTISPLTHLQKLKRVRKQKSFAAKLFQCLKGSRVVEIHFLLGRGGGDICMMVDALHDACVGVMYSLPFCAAARRATE
jgi:hypothetical protein